MKTLFIITVIPLAFIVVVGTAYNSFKEDSEAQDLAVCLNRVVTVLEGFETCIKDKQFKYETALRLRSCIVRNRKVTDPIESPYIIEGCYQ